MRWTAHTSACGIASYSPPSLPPTRPPARPQTAAANEQHYELPTEYFLRVLGPHRKYSSCLFERPDASLEEAEVAMLELCCERAQLQDGQQVGGPGRMWTGLHLGHTAGRLQKAPICSQPSVPLTRSLARRLPG